MRESISAAVESLVTSCVERVQYPDLDNVCRYVQYKKEYARFLEERDLYNAKVIEEQEAAVEQARSSFRIQNAALVEQVAWDWCPFWRVLTSADGILNAAVPRLPWVHDSMYTVNLID